MLPSRETPWLVRPEVASEEFAVTVTGEVYQPFAPLGEAGDRDASATGGVWSMEMVWGGIGYVAGIVRDPAMHGVNSIGGEIRLDTPGAAIQRDDLTPDPGRGVRPGDGNSHRGDDTSRLRRPRRAAGRIPSGE